MTEQQIYDQIENYLDGTMSTDERLAFEGALQNDATLQAKVDAHKVANELIIDNRLLAVSQLVHEVDGRTKQNNRSRRIMTYSGVLILLSLGAFFLFQNEPTVSNTLEDFEKSVETDAPTSPTREDISNATETEVIDAQSTTHQGVSHPTKEKTSKDVTAVEKEAPKATTLIENEEELEVTSTPSEESKTNTSLSIEEICKRTTIEAEITTTPSCYEEPTGNILLKNIRGGQAPYEVFITESNGKTTKRSVYGPGYYNIDVVDANGCLTALSKVNVAGKNCALTLAFNPFNGDVLHIDEYYDGGNVKIVDQKGSTVFEGTFEKGNKLTWNGVNNHGKIIEGFYILTIQSKDNKTQTAEVSVLK